jgi:hypothetical protein
MNDWWTCSGGPAASTPTPQAEETQSEAPSPAALPARRVLLGGALAARGWAAQSQTPPRSPT